MQHRYPNRCFVLSIEVLWFLDVKCVFDSLISLLLQSLQQRVTKMKQAKKLANRTNKLTQRKLERSSNMNDRLRNERIEAEETELPTRLTIPNRQYICYRCRTLLFFVFY